MFVARRRAPATWSNDPRRLLVKLLAAGAFATQPTAGRWPILGEVPRSFRLIVPFSV
jgi:hypothetical protein